MMDVFDAIEARLDKQQERLNVMKSWANAIETRRCERLIEMAVYEQAQDDCERRQHGRFVWLGAVAGCLAFWIVVWVVVGAVL